MDDLSLEQKQQQFHEFFTIKHRLNVNVLKLADDFELPDAEDLIHHMPYAFRMASEMAELETKAIRPLRGLSDHANELVEFLNHQSKKIDLMMSYVLHQQDEVQHRYDSISFGGGGVSLQSPSPFELGKQFQLKMFIEEEASAVFCFAETIRCEANDDGFEVMFIFSRIREQDQELLVRSSLHLQTKQLKKRSQQSD